MNQSAVKNAVEKADRWTQSKNRVRLISLEDGRAVASFPVDSLSKENMKEIKSLPESWS